MRVLNVVFEDEDYAFLLEVKKDKDWRKFLLDMAHNEQKRGSSNG